MPVISIITATRSRTHQKCSTPTTDQSPFPVLITSLPRRHLLGLFVIEMLYRQESPLSLRLGNAQQRHNPKQPRASIYEYEPKRGNMLVLNNFRMVNVIELVSKSHKSQGLKGSTVSSSI